MISVVCGAECIGDHDCQFDENCRSLGTSICPQTCQKSKNCYSWILEFLLYINFCLVSIVITLVYLYKEPYRKECCNERKANCLACEQGISVKEFCRKILQNPLMMYSNRYPECKGSLKVSILQFRKSLYFRMNIHATWYTFSGTQCKEDFVSSPWDTCNKCKCKNGKVTRNCQQTEMQGGLALMWQMSFYFIGCSGIYS